MDIIGIIPARLESTRFPGKTMQTINGMPLIGHIYHRAKMCQDFTDVVVATPDEEIRDYIHKLGGKTVYQPVQYESALERCANALEIIEQDLAKTFDIVVVIQGDEPMVTADMTGNAISPLIMDSSLQVSCLMSEITNDTEFDDPNEVKVVVDINNNAMYFSREPIPSRRKGAVGFPKLKVVGITPMRRDFLLNLKDLPLSPLEAIESIDLIRFIENGIKVKMVMTDRITYSVDTPADLEKVRNLMQDDPWMKRYI